MLSQRHLLDEYDGMHIRPEVAAVIRGEMIRAGRAKVATVPDSSSGPNTEARDWRCRRMRERTNPNS